MYPEAGFLGGEWTLGALHSSIPAWVHLLLSSTSEYAAGGRTFSQRWIARGLTWRTYHPFWLLLFLFSGHHAANSFPPPRTSLHAISALELTYHGLELWKTKSTKSALNCRCWVACPSYEKVIITLTMLIAHVQYNPSGTVLNESIEKPMAFPIWKHKILGHWFKLLNGHKYHIRRA